MIHLHPKPEAQRIDWHGAAVCWLVTFLMLHLMVWLDFIRS